MINEFENPFGKGISWKGQASTERAKYLTAQSRKKSLEEHISNKNKKNAGSQSPFPSGFHSDIALKVYKSITQQPNLYLPDGLIEHYVYSDGSAGTDNVYSSDNCLWGMFLQALGRQAESEKVYASIKPLASRQDSLVAGCVHNRISGKVSGYVSSSDNSLWGIFLQTLGRQAESEKVYAGMKSLSNLCRPDGLVADYVQSDGSIGCENIYSAYNIMWGIFLQTLGRTAESEKVYARMKSMGNLCRSDSLVMYYAKSDGSKGISDVYSSDNCLWGMFLQALGRQAESEKVYACLIKSFGNLCCHDSLLVDYASYDKSKNTASSKSNSLWGMFLQSLGRQAESEKVYAGMKSLGNLCRQDELVSGYVNTDGSAGNGSSIYSDRNPLWGLFLLGNGYKVFTGGR